MFLLWLMPRCSPKSHMVIGGAVSKMAGSKACGAGTDLWYSARLKVTRIKGLSATKPK